MSDKKTQEKKVDETIKSAAKEADKSTKEVDAILEEVSKKVKFLLSPAGKFLLPYNVGQVVELDEKKAKEVVEAKYAEYL